ncbi:Hypothetical_protein [Hexamita inflata]|uniref:Hypothetical_protein n=1 Tax=Hexamita inflata TaxID=28002 RepID=A0AA86UD50_9EUKA|nr:Hypothetical protein HINF_LOCUS41055 [Hexamita inflata]
MDAVQVWSVPAHSCQTQCAVGAKLSSLVSLERIQIAMFMIQLGADMLLQWPIALSPRTIRIRLAPTTSRHVRGADFIMVVPAFKSLRIFGKLIKFGGAHLCCSAPVERTRHGGWYVRVCT